MSRSGGRAVVLIALGLLWTPGACGFALPMQTTLRPIACAAAAQSKAVQSGAAQCFLVTSCQAGAEKLLKAELARTHPELRFAYSRPGLVTFKNSPADGIVSPTVSISSSFSRVHGASVGQARTASEICVLARQLFSGRPLCLHVWGRDLGSVRSTHPAAVSERAAQVVALRRNLVECAPDLWSPSEVADEGSPVLSVILGDEEDLNFVGIHTHELRISPSANP
jgi:23S rRNA (cytidine2498-2'-O)-methyltransferase